MPILDQGALGICYAEAPAEVLEYELRLSGKNVSVSPIDLAVESSSLIQKLGFGDPIQSGDFRRVFEVASKKGVVSKECVDEELQKLVGDKKLSPEDVVYLIDKINATPGLLSLKKPTLAEINFELEKDGHLETSCEVEDDVSHILQNEEWKISVSEVLLQSIRFCRKNRISLPKIEFDKKEKGTPSEFLAFVDQVLGRHKPALTTLLETEGAATHDLVIVGRRLHQGKCEYLLRNSYGEKWNQTGQTCACRDPDGKYYQDCQERFKQTDVLEARYAAAKTPENLKALLAHKDQDTRVSFVGCWEAADELGKKIQLAGGVK